MASPGGRAHLSTRGRQSCGPSLRGPCCRRRRELRGLGGRPLGAAPEGRTPAQFPRKIWNKAGQPREHTGPTGSQPIVLSPPHVSPSPSTGMDAKWHDCNSNI